MGDGLVWGIWLCLLWPGEECWRGMELRSGQPGACWADGIERGKSHQLFAALSAPLSTKNPLFSPPHSKYMFSPIWREGKRLGDRDWGSRKAKRTWFSSWRVQNGGVDRFCKETINENKKQVYVQAHELHCVEIYWAYWKSCLHGYIFALSTERQQPWAHNSHKWITDNSSHVLFFRVHRWSTFCEGVWALKGF